MNVELPPQPEPGKKFEHTCPYFGTKRILTYTGTRREIKEVLFDFFETENGQTVFFSPFEVQSQMKPL